MEKERDVEGQTIFEGRRVWTVGSYLIFSPTLQRKMWAVLVPTRLNLLELPSVMYRGQDLALVPDDSWVLGEPLDVLGAIGGDLVDVEAVEGPSEVGPLLAHELPAEACLEDAAGEVLEVGIIVCGSSVCVYPAG